MTHTEEAEGLAPCPWCGSTEVRISNSGSNYTMGAQPTRKHQALCGGCGARGPRTRATVDAVNTWNAGRQDPPRLPRCPKCGGDDCSVAYHLGGYILPSENGCDCNSFSSRKGPHLHRKCRACSYDWTEDVREDE